MFSKTTSRFRTRWASVLAALHNMVVNSGALIEAATLESRHPSLPHSEDEPVSKPDPVCKRPSQK